MQWSLNQDINHLIPEFACQILSAKVWLDNLCVKKAWSKFMDLTCYINLL